MDFLKQLFTFLSAAVKSPPPANMKRVLDSNTFLKLLQAGSLYHSFESFFYWPSIYFAFGL